MDNKQTIIENNLELENIKNTVNELPDYIDTTDGTATAEDILEGKSAYVNGEKLEGTMTNNGELNYTPSLEEQTIPEGYTSGGVINAVDSTIDENILPENIKKDIEILGVTGILESGGGSDEWKRPDDWWDCQTILDNAENKTNSAGATVYPAYIILIDDTELSTTFSKTTSNKALQGDAYLTSDGVFYNTDTATHTWDLSKDKKCSKGYKTRYVIIYMRNKSDQYNIINLANFNCLEVTSKQDLKNHFRFGSSSSAEANRKIQSINLSGMNYVGETDFKYCYSLRNANLPNITSIGSSGFASCNSLQNVNAPNITYIGTQAFSGCYNLLSADFPNVTELGKQAFQSCALLKKVNLPNITSIGDYTFSGCYNLLSVDFPNVITVGSSVFNSCYTLQSINLKNATTLGNNVFYLCYSLQSINLENVTTIGENICNSCYSLSSIELPSTIQAIPNTTSSFGAFLKNIILPNNFNLPIKLTGETSLTHSALVDILNKLKDLTDEDSKTITLGSTNLAKITNEEKAIATNKNWIVS